MKIKKDRQLDLTENQKTKQSDPIGKIKFSDKILNKLAEDVIKKKRQIQKFNLYKNLEEFVKQIMNGKLSIKKSKEQQDESWNLIYKMKKRTSEKKRGKKFSTKNKKIVLNLIKVGNELYSIRDKVINALDKKEILKPNFEIKKIKKLLMKFQTWLKRILD